MVGFHGCWECLSGILILNMYMEDVTSTHFFTDSKINNTHKFIISAGFVTFKNTSIKSALCYSDYLLILQIQI